MIPNTHYNTFGAIFTSGGLKGQVGAKISKFIKEIFSHNFTSNDRKYLLEYVLRQFWHFFFLKPLMLNHLCSKYTTYARFCSKFRNSGTMLKIRFRPFWIDRDHKFWHFFRKPLMLKYHLCSLLYRSISGIWA